MKTFNKEEREIVYNRVGYMIVNENDLGNLMKMKSVKVLGGKFETYKLLQCGLKNKFTISYAEFLKEIGSPYKSGVKYLDSLFVLDGEVYLDLDY